MNDATSPTTAAAPLVTAHRGDVEQHRENTLAAVRAAVEAGADFVEVDVRLTRDGYAVLLHDPTLERMWEDPRDIGDVDWADVAALGRGEGKDHRIPLLSDALDLVAGTGSVLLIDMDEPGPAQASVAVVRSHAQDARAAGTEPARVAWCGNLEAMTIVRGLDTDASVWLPWNRRDLPPAELLARLRPHAVNSDYAVLSQTLVDAAHTAGALAACWTVDTEDGMRWALALGADAVTTNRLSVLRTVIAEGRAAWEAAPHPRHLASAELAAAAAVAHELALWAIEHTRQANLGVISTKANPADHVTEVDLAVEQHVRQVIAARLPGHLVVGEELGGTPAPGVPCWYVDPVDGTANLANGMPWTAFSLALAIDHEPLVAVVADIWRGNVLAAVAGYGAEADGDRLDLSDGAGMHDVALPGDAVVGLAGTVVATELLGHLPWPGFAAFLDEMSRRFCTVRVMGSGTLSLAGVAVGRGAGGVVARFSPIDHLAAVLIVREAGGVVLDEDGRPTAWPESGGVLAARPEHAAELHEAWTAALRADLEPARVD
ncbi:inositol monophosphatase family protein [Sinomonas sp. P10A9]|uniref:Inositol monophosphatase family protein n=1 Tax=Sinomonas puerhi TaxID=3238584 RepID=A0AB39L684_9MICC